MSYVALRIEEQNAVVKLSPMSPKNAAAVALGRKGGHARAKKLSPEQRSEAARKAVEARWAKTEKLVAEITVGTKALVKKVKARAKQKKEKG
jgi:hypothetical protein